MVTFIECLIYTAAAVVFVLLCIEIYYGVKRG